MTDIAILWDASQIWGLLAWRAAEAFGLPYRLIKAQEIAHGALSDKTSLLLVPGGTARHKSAALGEQGRRALVAWVEAGGHYLGFCGGAGFGLCQESHNRVSSAPNLGLCPWQRATITERMQHFISGHVRVECNPTHPLALDTALTIPVWWPGRFAMPGGTQDVFFGERADGVEVLARYAGADPRTCPADLCVADLPLASLSQSVLEQWVEQYGVSLTPDFLNGQPCVVHGKKGKGSYTLSYSHLETPASPDANRWLSHLFGVLTGGTPHQTLVPDWKPGDAPLVWEDEVLIEARAGMDALMALGRAHGLLFDRASWLTGWRAGVPGSGLNNLYTALCVMTSCCPTPQTLARWQTLSERFKSSFALFREGVEGLLLAQRLAAIMPEAVPRTILAERRAALFGSAMQGGGVYKELMDMLDAMLFLHLGGGTHGQ
ncbi:MAG: BPL-N domain-containing protein [Bilophila sp.]